MLIKEFDRDTYEKHLAKLGPRAKLVEALGATYVDRNGQRWARPGSLRRDVPLVVKSAPRPSAPSPAPAPPPAADDSDLLRELRGRGEPDAIDRYVDALPASRPVAPARAVADDTSDLLRELNGGDR